MMKKTFKTPIVKVIVLPTDDAIRTSSGAAEDPNNDEGWTGFY